jgi:membrane protein YdbS with pleckstrin-like domain
MTHTHPEKRIARSAIRAWRISALLYGLIFLAVPGLLIYIYIYDDIPLAAPVITSVVGVSLYLIVVFVVPAYRWKRWYYEVHSDAVDMLSGIIIRTRTVVPVNRIQHVDTKQGPIYRKFGLSSISISTAATTHEIPALDDQTADELRTIISDYVRKAREDV